MGKSRAAGKHRGREMSPAAAEADSLSIERHRRRGSRGRPLRVGAGEAEKSESPNGRGDLSEVFMHTGSYIEGKWHHPKSERLVRNVNPADTGDVLAEFPAATAADVERAIAAASAAF